MSGHIHAELMAQYAEDARETDAPWERWEFKGKNESLWRNLSASPAWDKGSEYRRKPRTITINGREVPEPMRQAPEVGKDCYIPDITSQSLHYQFFYAAWDRQSADRAWIQRGLVHSTKEAAIAHAEALLSFTEAK